MALVHCTRCGHQISTTAVRCPNCGASPSSAPNPQAVQTGSPQSAQPPMQKGSLDTAGVKQRYQDAYRIARTIVGFGSFIKYVAFAFGLGAFLLGLGRVGDTPTSALIGLLGAALFALLVTGCFYIVAVLVSAQGQVLQATLDTAVYSSPFLQDSDRAEIMTLI
jgi:hypothetical protein